MISLLVGLTLYRWLWPTWKTGSYHIGSYCSLQSLKFCYRTLICSANASYSRVSCVPCKYLWCETANDIRLSSTPFLRVLELFSGQKRRGWVCQCGKLVLRRSGKWRSGVAWRGMEWRSGGMCHSTLVRFRITLECRTFVPCLAPTGRDWPRLAPTGLDWPCLPLPALTRL